ncbi:hypothetical protein D9756_006620 [Leucocoprinus leucothites]|uniref:Uncharacterized protein n=1 Tax=Leucocoprinus leucothites TaxID=201217 RepID=A0A8H5LHD5_9AGAR|nr:hypothetical protein D9756_006620 [Leucoagaricus leucothites]
MKFAKYLRDTQTPEWKRAYIDYRGLKKHITAIRQAQIEAVQLGGPSVPRHSLNEERASNAHTEDTDSETPSKTSSSSIPPTDTAPRTHERASPQLTRRRGSTWSKRTTMAQSAIPSIKRSKTQALSNLNGPQSRPINPMAVLPLHELLTHLTPQEASFFHYLDAQLDKVESFYSSREKVLLLRTQLLQKQLHEFHNHRKFVHEANENNAKGWSSSATTALKLKLRRHPVIDMSATNSQADASKPIASPKGKAASGRLPMLNPVSSIAHVGPSNETEKAKTSSFQEAGRPGQPRFSDLDYYLHARKKLKKAVLEHYRGLELLLNYRILNLTGFRKALKKFDKIRTQDQYMAEKVDQSALGSDSALQQMMKEMQELYAQTFFRGNSKKAMDRLRGGIRTKTHHFSTLRSGILIGAAIPALASGLYYSFLEETREQIPDWDALLYFYGIFLIPVVFSILIGLNLLVWARSRVNYTFIFELDDLLMDWSLLRTRAKHFFLRDELGYSNHIYLYYFAIVTNCLIRFAWVIYIPEEGPNTLIRTFIVGFLEMLRRVQWNFYRLENEHLGNMDQYRVTREVPLPYTFDTNHRGDYDGDDSEQLSEPQSPTSDQN